MKLAVAGKGGVGKTTLVALLAREAAARGQRVLAIDADPNPNLAAALGFPEPIPPLTDQEELIAARAGRGGLVSLTPAVDDLLDRYGFERDGIRILVMGGVREGGGGCACPASALLRALLRHLLLTEDVLLLDMEAGLEPLGRGTAQGMDALVVVVDPDPRSVETALRIRPLARDLGLAKVVAVGNKVRRPEDEAYLRESLPPDLPLIGELPFLPELWLPAGAATLPAAVPAIENLFLRLTAA